MSWNETYSNGTYIFGLPNGGGSGGGPGGGGGGVISANLATARVSGVAPLYVNFDATGTTSTASTNPMHELLYVWSFGDSGAGNWVNGVQSSGLTSKNTDYGPVSGHVYETPGTYTVNLTVMDGVNTSTQSVTITVQDPNTVYAGSNTICFSQTSSFTGAPSGATLINTAGATDMLAQWNTYAASNVRLLWNKAQSWTASNTMNLANMTGTFVGGFGTGTAFSTGFSGAAPSGTGVPITASFSAFNALFTIGANVVDSRFCEMVIAANATVSVGAMYTSTVQTLWYKIQISGQSQGWNSVPGELGQTYMTYDQHCLYECRTDNTVGSAFVDDGAAGNSGGVGFYIGSIRGGFMGCYADNNNHGEQTLRMPFQNTTHINHNYIARSNQSKNVVKIHSVNFSLAAVYSEKFVFSSNVMDMRGGYSLGGTTSLGNTVTSTGSTDVVVGNGDGSNNQRVRNGLFENNYTYGGRGQTQTVAMFSIDCPGCTVRNNIADFYQGVTGTNVAFTPTYAYAVQVLLNINTSAGVPTVNVNVYNNTLYTNNNNAQTGIAFIFGQGTTGITLKNNIIYAPFTNAYWKTIPYAIDNGVTGVVVVASNNSADQTASPNFVNIPPVTLTDWKPNTGSYAIGAGATVPVQQDFFRASRTGTYSMGAVLP